MSFLAFIFSVFIIGFIVVLFVAISFFLKIRKATKQFRNQFQGSPNKPKDDTITDRRTEEERNRQIIPDDEGEYVDYEEVDDSKSGDSH